MTVSLDRPYFNGKPCNFVYRSRMCVSCRVSCVMCRVSCVVCRVSCVVVALKLRR
jgi:hypothetical protein